MGELGAAFPVPEVGGRLRCTGCGGKDIATRPAWPGLGPVTSHAPDPEPAPDPDPGAETPADAPSDAAAPAEATRERDPPAHGDG
jgi:hypothetical protein